MRTLEQQLSYEHLELIEHSKPSLSQTIGDAIVFIGRQLLKSMTRLFLESNAPHIWCHKTQTGHQVWYVREPHTSQVSRFNSEHEVMEWLDTRYHT